MMSYVQPVRYPGDAIPVGPIGSPSPWSSAALNRNPSGVAPFYGSTESDVANTFGVFRDNQTGGWMSKKPLVDWAGFHGAINKLRGTGPQGSALGVTARYGPGNNVQPLTRGQQIKQLVDQGKLPTSALFETVNLTQPLVPGAGLEDIAARTADATKQFKMPTFDEYKKQASDLTGSYSRANAALDPTIYINKLNEAQAGLLGITTDYQGQLGEAGQIAQQGADTYRTEGQAAQDAAMANERANYANAQKQADLIAKQGMAYMSRYGAGAGGGAGSEMPGLYAKATLPSILAANERASGRITDQLNRGGVLAGNLAASQRDLAGFGAQLSGLGLQAGSAVYQNAQNIATTIQNVLQSNSQQQLAMARQQLLDVGVPEQAFNDALQKVQAGQLSLIAAAADLSQRYGKTGFVNYVPGAEVAQTGQSNLPQPNYPTNNPRQPQAQPAGNTYNVYPGQGQAQTPSPALAQGYSPRYPDWVNRERAAQGWQQDANTGNYTINRPYVQA
jgi:hypothetical protein